MQDHVAMGGLAFMVNQPVTINFNRVYSLKTAMQYAIMGEGPLTIPGGVEGLGFINTKFANSSDDFPDIEYFFVAGIPVFFIFIHVFYNKFRNFRKTIVIISKATFKILKQIHSNKNTYNKLPH